MFSPLSNHCSSLSWISVKDGNEKSFLCTAVTLHTSPPFLVRLVPSGRWCGFSSHVNPCEDRRKLFRQTFGVSRGLEQQYTAQLLGVAHVSWSSSLWLKVKTLQCIQMWMAGDLMMEFSLFSLSHLAPGSTFALFLSTWQNCILLMKSSYLIWKYCAEINDSHTAGTWLREAWIPILCHRGLFSLEHLWGLQWACHTTVQEMTSGSSTVPDRKKGLSYHEFTDP